MLLWVASTLICAVLLVMVTSWYFSTIVTAWWHRIIVCHVKLVLLENWWFFLFFFVVVIIDKMTIESHSTRLDVMKQENYFKNDFSSQLSLSYQLIFYNIIWKLPCQSAGKIKADINDNATKSLMNMQIEIQKLCYADEKVNEVIISRNNLN